MIKRKSETRPKNAAKHPVNKTYVTAALLLLVPMRGFSLNADANNGPINDPNVIRYLQNYINKGTYATINGGNTHSFETAVGGDGWYHVNTATALSDGMTDSVSFRFIINDDGSYTARYHSHNFGTTFAAPPSSFSWQDAPGTAYVRMSDRHPNDPLTLSDDHSKCFGIYQWPVDVDQSNYLDKVKVSWDGEALMRT